ncbi:hypothetical protein EDB95_1510 [Dinghuibacter silviterrae]|uniref:Uncharacterized protein n=1 Tax=Dinghuibacter silviterrae TaxID=1539049 RepID=A0A4R8DSU9_9BACT|nr:hypothetical protein EDB95_1510 [Dinghuibacter silviterrae]
MDINIPLLIKYVAKNGYQITVSVPIGQDAPYLVLILGDNHEGSRREILQFDDLYQILKLNNIIGDDPASHDLVRQLLDLPGDHKDSLHRSEKIEHMIYDTIAKYVLQLLITSRGELLYPYIKPLQKHEARFNHN